MNAQVRYFRTLACTLICLLTAPGCSHDVPAPSSKPSSVAASWPIRETVDLGVLFQGESIGINRWLRNTSDREIDVTKIEKTCECVDVKPSKFHLRPGERVLAVFTYDGKKEPDFLGTLGIQLTLSDGDGNTVGRIEVPVEIVSKKDYEKGLVSGQ